MSSARDLASNVTALDALASDATALGALADIQAMLTARGVGLGHRARRDFRKRHGRRPLVLRGRKLEVIKEYWAVIVGFVALIAWAVRLEAGVKQAQSDIRGLWKQRNEDLEASKEARTETNRFLERLDAKMDMAFNEFRSDIKTLLQRKWE